MANRVGSRDTSIRTYRAKRDFTATAEPAPGPAQPSSETKLFVIQKHHAHRAGLHWDLRLEYGGVLWSWAVRKGPSLDPADRRMAVHVEDHPIEYADFQGAIPDGQYGAGKVETWDRGTWTALEDAEEGMRKGHLRFELSGQRLHGRFTLARLKQRDPKKQEGWFLIKGRDAAAREGVDALRLEQEVPFPAAPAPRSRPKARGKNHTEQPPIAGAVRAPLPEKQEPQLCAIAEEPPDGPEWLSEIKFDGYRLIASVEEGKVRLLTRNGHDWAERMPTLASAIARLPVKNAMLDGELVSLREDGVSSFAGLQTALKAGRDDTLVFFCFDLLHLDDWDFRSCALLERKRVLADLADWTGMLRYSDHHRGDTQAVRKNACRMQLEGIICKQTDAAYRSGRSSSWVKVKCSGREEFVVLGWTPPGGSRVGLGALHVGYYDQDGRPHYAGGVGTGFDDEELLALRKRLDGMQTTAPAGLSVSGDPIDNAVTWVRPEIVVEVQFTGWSGAGRVRHPVYLGTRDDKLAAEVVREVADPEAERTEFKPRRIGRTVVSRKGWHGAVPPRPQPSPAAKTPARAAAGNVVIARAPKKAAVEIGGISLSHADRQLWPGITKQQLAEYWQAIAAAALPGLAHRPLSILRCPEGINGREQFFQKNGHGIMPAAIREGSTSRQPYLAIDGVEGLIAMAQMSAIELHAWGANEADPARPDQLVFDLDPGEGVPWPEIVRAAHDVRDRLRRLGLASFCRTTGGKGLHVVVPLRAEADWGLAKPFCRAFAETMAQEEPERFLAHLKIADRRGRILVDWLRNGLGATAIASFSPRARPGATVATPVAWDEVTAKLDPAKYTVRTVPERLSRLKTDPWDGFGNTGQRLPELLPRRAASPTAGLAPGAAAKTDARKGRPVIVVAAKPRPRR
ncbi:MAG: DNA ligase D [Acetobacteraceae bacterium]|nr:DNA ligase D [Acetobacteraceae bacterium]